MLTNTGGTFILLWAVWRLYLTKIVMTTKHQLATQFSISHRRESYLDDSVELGVVVVAAPRQLREVPAGERCVLPVQLHHHLAHTRVHGHRGRLPVLIRDGHGSVSLYLVSEMSLLFSGCCFRRASLHKSYWTGLQGDYWAVRIQAPPTALIFSSALLEKKRALTMTGCLGSTPLPST